MKRIIRILLVWVVLFGTFSVPVYAGSINSAEQKILDAISSVYLYRGGYYKVLDSYIEKVSAYLSQDGVDLTDSQADSYLDQFYANIGAGISSGYMEKVGEVESNKKPGSTDKVPDLEETSKESNSTDKEDGNTGNSASANVSDENSTEGTTETESADETPVIDKTNDFEDAVVIEVTEEGNVDNTLGSTIDGIREYSVAATEPQDMYVWDIEELNVHAEAYKDSDLLGTLTRGTKVVVTGAATTGWAQIEYEGKEAYVSSVFLRTSGYMKAMGFEVETEEAATIAGSEATTNSEEMETEDNAKDYSDAEPFRNNISLGTIAIGIVLLVAVVLAGIVITHNNKRYKRK